MTRTEKKCLVASSGLHLFAVLLLVFGSAFFVAEEKPVPFSKLRVVPTKWVESALAGGGGNPNLARNEDDVQKGTLAPVPAPPAASKTEPPPPQPQPVAPPPVPPAPPRQDKQPLKVEVPKVEPVKRSTVKPVEVTKPKPVEPPPKKYNIDLSELQRVDKAKEAEREKEREKAKAEADARSTREAVQRANAARQRLAQEFNRAAADMRQGFASGTKVEVGGPGGEAFANYGALVQSAYDDAWRVLPDLANDDFITVVRITIAREGRILSSQIIRRSSSPMMDKSVQRALDKVRAEGLPPFPEFIKDPERSFTIEFNLKTKKLLG